MPASPNAFHGNDKAFMGNFIAVHECIGSLPTISSHEGDSYYGAKQCACWDGIT